MLQLYEFTRRLTIAAVLASTLTLFAQTNPGRVTNPLQISLTGCLKRNAATRSYTLSDQNGNLWELRSSSVDLSAQVNHSVVVTGKPGTGQPPPSDGQPAQGSQAGDQPKDVLRVLTVRMLSPSCTR